MNKILFTGGLGDIFAVDMWMSDYEKRMVGEIYLATPGAKFIKQALAYHRYWKDLPVNELLTKEQIAQYAPSKYCVHSTAELNNVCRAASLPVAPDDVMDMSIAKIFFEVRSGLRRWSGSMFMFPILPCDLAFNYATTSGDFRINGRNFTPYEIEAVQ